ncbi:hypothetical protein V6N13_086980 [Hibiscus sabdariffa]
MNRITQAVQLLLENPPQQEWFCSQPLQSPFFTSPPPSPCFFFKITRSLPSYCQAFNFFKHFKQSLPSEATHFLSYPFQAGLEKASRELDAGSRLLELHVLLRDGHVEYALKVLDEMLQPLSDVPPDEVTGDIVFYGLVKRNRNGRT